MSSQTQNQTVILLSQDTKIKKKGKEKKNLLQAIHPLYHGLVSLEK
jgi:hypothetical protein